MKTTGFVGLFSLLIGMSIGNQIPRGVVSSPVSISTFKIKVPFDQWSSGFDNKEAQKLHRANKIKPLFRGVSIEDPSKVIVIHRSKPGLVEKLISENKDMIESTGHIIRTTRTTNWSFE